MKKAVVKAVNFSEKKGVAKRNIQKAEITEMGLKNDAHAGPWHRQISLLAEESIEKMRKLGLDLKYGDFGENITTNGIDLYNLPIGTKFKINDVILELTQIGKSCHSECAIKQKVGKCIMPREGVFTRVIKPGYIEVGHNIEIIKSE